jgi:cysteinyl-tRNA synthetase
MLFDVLALQPEEKKGGDDLSGRLMNTLLGLRADAKASKDFALSDRIRDKLAAVGITIKDTKEGTVWEQN